MNARANARLACESLLVPSALFPPLRGLTLEPAPAPPPAHGADDAGLPVSQPALPPPAAPLSALAPLATWAQHALPTLHAAVAAALPRQHSHASTASAASSPAASQRVVAPLSSPPRMSRAPSRTSSAPPRGVPAPSAEQRAVLDAFFAPGARQNILLRACAGSGKTTMALQLAAEIRARGGFMLLLTYSASLKRDVEAAAAAAGIGKCLDVRTFHSLCRQWYPAAAAATGGAGAASAAACTTDADVQRAVSTDAPVAFPERLPPLAAIFIDEAQDVTEFLFRFLRKFLADCLRAKGGAPPQLVVSGDARQAVHGYRGADARFLTLADRLWANDRPWAARTLSTTYRLPGSVAALLNACAAPLEAGGASPALRPHKGAGAPVELHIGRAQVIAARLGRELAELITSKRVAVEDVLVIARSTRGAAGWPCDDDGDDDGGGGGSARRRGGSGGSLLTAFIKQLDRAGIAAYIRSSDNDGAGADDEDLVRGKVLICTMASSKGRQARYVYVLQPLKAAAAAGTRRPAAGDATLPTDFFVSYSRASERLFIIGETRVDNVHPCLPHAVRDVLMRDGVLDVVTDEGYKLQPASVPRAVRAALGAVDVLGDCHPLAVTELHRHCCAVELERIRDALAWTRTESADAPLHVVNKVQNDGGIFCDVSAHLGLALPAALERASRMAKDARDDSCKRLDALVEKLAADERAERAGFPRHELDAELVGSVLLLAAKSAETRRDAVWHSALAALTIATGLHTGLPRPSEYTSLPWGRPSHWLAQDVFAAGLARLQAAIPRWAEAEYEAELPVYECGTCALSGRADVLAPDMLVVIKATAGALTPTQQLQLAAYASLFLRSDGGLRALEAADTKAAVSHGLPAFLLFNVASGERWQLRCEGSADAEAIHAAVDELVALKLARQCSRLLDAHFVTEMLMPHDGSAEGKAVCAARRAALLLAQPLPSQELASEDCEAWEDQPPSNPADTDCNAAVAPLAVAASPRAGTRRSRAEAGFATP